MGYANWTEMDIVNTSGKTLSFQNAQYQWGKFYSCENGCWRILPCPYFLSLT